MNPSDIDVLLGNIPYGPTQPGTIQRFKYFAGSKYGWLWSFSYYPKKPKTE